MNEPGGWTTPEGWGGPTSPPPAGPTPEHGQPSYGQPSYGQQGPGTGPAPWGQRPVELKPGVVPLRPLGLGELLDGAVGIIRRYPRPALGLSAIVAIVTTLLNVALLVTAFQPLLDLDVAALESGDTAGVADAIGGAAAGGFVTILLALLSGAVLTGGLTAVVSKAVLGEPIGFAEACRQLRPVLLRLIGLALLVLLIVYGILLAGTTAGLALIALGGPLLAIVGVPLILATLVLCPYVYIRLSLAPCVLVLERTGILTSLRRSSALVKRDWWRVFGILLLTLLIGGFVSQIVQLPFAVLGAGSPGNLFDPDADVLGLRPLILTAIGGGIASTVVAPFTASVRALLYVDRRMRSEGLDVALTAAVGARR